MSAPATNAKAIFADLAEQNISTHEKGDRLERLTKRYLQTVPPYADLFDRVWLWSEWPDRWGSDIGIDLVAHEAGTGRYWAIQCKFYAPDQRLPKEGIEAFIAASGKVFTTSDGVERQFDERLIVSTTDQWSKKALEVTQGQDPPVQVLDVEKLDEAAIDWRHFYWERPETLPSARRKTLRNHQQEALDAVTQGFENADRGQMIMACGTGKTFTALRIAETKSLVPDGGQVLVLVPSLALVGQTLREWGAQAERGFHAFVVCSDRQIKKDSDDITTRDLAYPATTDPGVLAKRIAAVTAAVPERPNVVFSTYQSVQTVCDAQARHGVAAFDLAICDEAHRTAGISLNRESVSQESEFTKPLNDDYLATRKRLFMTATPRVYGLKSQQQANEADATLYSMDDPAYFGKEFYRLNFGEAVDRGLLADYRVLIVAVDSAALGDIANSYNATYKLDDQKGISAEFATRLIGTWKGLTKQDAVTLDDAGREIPLEEDAAPMRRAVAFANSIKASREIRDSLEAIVGHAYGADEDGGDLPGDMHCEIQHVDGSMHAGQRHEALEWLRSEPDEGECRVLTNARCLSEGVDVPALDGVVFFHTRDSVVEIAQSVGRVMRKAPGKQYGYIVLPVEIPREETGEYARFIESDDRFKGIWKVLRSLRAHDERLVDEAEFRKKIRVVDGNGGTKSGDSDGGSEGVQTALDLPPLPVGDISEAVYGLIPKKLGDREYWASWARDVADMAQRLVDRIRALFQKPDGRKAFDQFLSEVRTSVSPSVTEEDAVQMLAQHIITRPVFEALFGSNGFAETNPVAAALDRVQERFAAYGLDAETAGLERFYQQVTERIQYARSDKSRQDIIRNLYDTFFQKASPNIADRLGIVYTPTQIVDFINRSADKIVREHFGQSLSDEGVHIIDPFTGTGSFLVRMIQQGLIDSDALPRKMDGELHANEVVLLAYYIATVNIETAYHEVTGEARPFEGAVLTDTFAMAEGTQRDYLREQVWLAGNSERTRKQRDINIQVVVGNPPYSRKQESGNESNTNASYPVLDQRISETYDARSSAKLRYGLYDSYIRAIRWASDRIGERGVVAFVTNGSFIDGNAADGLRRSLVEEFSTLYVLNLRGNQRTSGEESRKEGGKFFGQASRAPVAITVMIKDPAQKQAGEIYYYDIGDYLDRDTKLNRLESLKDVKGADLSQIEPGPNDEWIDRGDPDFERFPLIGRKPNNEELAVFETYSSGVKTNRDAWVYNFSNEGLRTNVYFMIVAYNQEKDKLRSQGSASSLDEARRKMDMAPDRVPWDEHLIRSAIRGRYGTFNEACIRHALYRPFTKHFYYFDPLFNNSMYRTLYMFPSSKEANYVITVSGKGHEKPFSTIVTDCVPNTKTVDTDQCFPRYYYEYVDQDSTIHQSTLFNHGSNSNEYGHICHDAITDWALEAFQSHYRDNSITKDAIFWYVYGLLHSSDYCERFRNNLRRELPRIPFVRSFWSFSEIGRTLGDWHLNYEMVEPHPLEEIVTEGCERDPRVHDKMRFPGKRGYEDKSTIIVNPTLKLAGIPTEAYDYQVNGYSPVEWLVKRYQHTTDKKSGIKSDPNTYSDDPEYIVNLIKCVVRVSLETRRLVNQLPPMVIEDSDAYSSAS